MTDTIKERKNAVIFLSQKKMCELRTIICDDKAFSGKRISHILGVEKECEELAEIFGFSESDKLRLCASGLLHDITKGKTLDEQLQLCRKYKIEFLPEAMGSPKVFHGWTASAVMRDKYADYCDTEMCSAVFVHTTGREKMTLFESLLYLADYIEPGRKFEDCLRLRGFFYEGVKNICRSDGDRLRKLKEHLDITLLKSFDYTISGLLDEGAEIFPMTLRSRNYLVRKAKKGLPQDKNKKLGK